MAPMSVDPRDSGQEFRAGWGRGLYDLSNVGPTDGEILIGQSQSYSWRIDVGRFIKPMAADEAGGVLHHTLEIISIVRNVVFGKSSSD